MSGDRLYLRKSRLLITKMSREVYFPRFTSGAAFDVTNTIEVTDLRVGFVIEKSLKDETPNTCVISVYNLSEKTRAFLQDDTPTHVQLEVGYDGTLAHIFSGDVIPNGMKHSHVGTEWVTRMQLGDGDRAFNHARISKSYRKGVNARALVLDLANSMGLKVPKNAEDAVNATFASSTAVSGPSHAEMTRLCKKHGLSWSIQDGELVVLGENGTTAPDELIISQDAGMIGTPEFSVPSKPGEPVTLNVSTLLYPEINPGRVIRVQSLNINSRFRVESVRHTGDTHAPENVTEIAAK